MLKIKKQKKDRASTGSEVIPIEKLDMNPVLLTRVLQGDYSVLVFLQVLAIRIAKYQGFVTIDDLRTFTLHYGIQGITKGMWGNVFRAKEWVKHGEQPSLIESNHRRKITLWVRK